MTTPLSFNGFCLRFLLALLLVAASYNPSGYSYLHWLIKIFPSITPLIALAGVSLLIGWVIYLRATLRSLGPVGLGLLAALLGCLVWLMIDLKWLSLNNISALSWIAIILMAMVLAIGISWSHIRRRLSGQVDTDDVED